MGGDDSIRDKMAALAFTEGFEPDVIDALTSIAQLAQYQEGDTLFREGQSNQEAYLVASGLVALEVRINPRESRRIQTLGAGELLGWGPLLGESVLSATARALKPTEALILHGPRLLLLCERDPRFGMIFMRRTAQALASRLSSTRLHLLGAFRTDSGTPEPDRDAG